MITKKLIISGTVQGVSYRAWMTQKANQLNIWGWVRNLEDGTVEALIYGDEDVLEELVLDCKQGPGLAQVNNIEIEDMEYDGTVGFEVRPDGP
jgi:acylphosphatase